MDLQQRSCLTCSTTFEVPGRSHRRFCSVACHPKQTHSRKAKKLVTVECAHCGESFERKEWEVKQRKSKGWAMYCSVKCRDAVKRGRKGEQRVARIQCSCEACGQPFELLPSDKPKRFCSVICARRTVRGNSTGRRPQYDKKSLSRDGYLQVYVQPSERPPGQEQYTRFPEHRYVMSKVLGRWPGATETVHHINGDRTDNRPENLQLRAGSHGRGHILRCRCCGSSDIEYVEI